MGDEYGQNVIDLAAEVVANGQRRGKSLAEMTPADIKHCPHGHIVAAGRWPDCEVCLATARMVGFLPATAEELAEARELVGADQAEQATDERYDDLYLPRSALADLPRGEPLIDGVLDRHTLFVLAGRDHTYKTFVIVDWLACLATGKAWMGREVQQTKVLLVVGEGAWGLHTRFAAWETAWNGGKQIDDDWLTIRRAPVNLFKQAAAFQDLLARIRSEGYGVVVFDTLQRNSTGANHDRTQDAGVIIESLDAVRQATGGAAGVVAHTDKGDNDTRGSSAFEDDADIVWRARRDEDEQAISLTLTKRKDGPAGLTIDLRPKLIEGTGSLIIESARSYQPNPDRPPAQAWPALRLLGSTSVPRSGLSATPLADSLGLKGRGGLYRALDWLIDAGYVQKVELGQYPSYKITPEGVSQLAQTMPDQQ